MGIARSTDCALAQARLHDEVGADLLVRGGAGRAVYRHFLGVRTTDRCVAEPVCGPQRRGALTIELRGATILARFLAEKQRGEEARTELAAVFSRIDEGRDAPVVIEAQELLRDLGCDAT